MDAGNYEASLFFWPPLGELILLENIPCNYWGWAGQYSETSEFNNSYMRIRELASGRVLANLSQTIGFGFGSSHVDYHTPGGPTAWVFGVPFSRCGRPLNVTYGVYAWHSQDLLQWEGGLTNLLWQGPNVDVAAVPSPPAGLPWHSHVMIFEDGSLALNNGTDGDLLRNWFYLDSAFHVPSCGCPSIRFVPTPGGGGGTYYALHGQGDFIGLHRSTDLAHWEASAASPLIVPSSGDGAIIDLADFPKTVDESGAWYARKGENTTREVLSNLPDWDWNSNDPDLCCDSWPGGGAEAVRTSYFVFGSSTQGHPMKGGLTGPDCFQTIAIVNGTLDDVLASFF